MNETLKRLMLEAGYAAPELATRAQKLAQLITLEVLESVREVREVAVENNWHVDETCETIEAAVSNQLEAEE